MILNKTKDIEKVSRLAIKIKPITFTKAILRNDCQYDLSDRSERRTKRVKDISEKLLEELRLQLKQLKVLKTNSYKCTFRKNWNAA